MERLTQSSERIEKTLSKRKGHYMITLNGTDTTFEYRYNPALDLSGNYEIDLILLDTYYSVTNVTSHNNLLKIFDRYNWNLVTIPEGSYDIDAITSTIGISQVRIFANTATLRSIIKISNPFKVDFDVPNSLSSLLGFEKKYTNLV